MNKNNKCKPSYRTLQCIYCVGSLPETTHNDQRTGHFSAYVMLSLWRYMPMRPFFLFILKIKEGKVHQRPSLHTSMASPWPPPPLPVSLHQHPCCLPATAVGEAQFLACPILRPSNRWEPGPFYCKRWPIPKPPFGPVTSLLLGLETGALLLQSQDQEVVMIPVQLGHGPWENPPLLKSHVGGFVDRYRHQPPAQISLLQVLLFSVRICRHTTRRFFPHIYNERFRGCVIIRQSCSAVWEKRLTLRLLLHLGWGYSI